MRSNTLRTALGRTAPVIAPSVARPNFRASLAPLRGSSQQLWWSARDASSASDAGKASTVEPDAQMAAEASAAESAAASTSSSSEPASSIASSSQASSSSKPASEPADGHAAALEAKDQEIAKFKDLALRSKADMSNLQKQTQQRVDDAKSYSISKMALDLVADLDVLDIALRSVPEPLREGGEGESGTALKDLYNGVSMTHQGVVRTLARYGITPFDPTGEPFNPTIHDALYQAPIPDKKPGTVLECQKKGWMIKSRCLRPAQVGVVQA